ncbi:hypothetical protein [Streptomyces sp. NPDC005476]|uniref:hypothetical protein n=1 Tax=Streptomyces sp. NPDC005476 TaxID=3156882 RepID=UPI003455FA92
MVSRGATAHPYGRVAGWGWFLGWLAVGGLAGVGLAAILTVGIALVLVAAVGAGLLLWQGPRNATAGLVAGPALPLLYIAYLNRSGPGNVCHTVTGGQTCIEEYPPIPFLFGGVIFLAAGFLIFTTLNRRNKGTG